MSKRDCKICGKYTEHEDSAIHSQCRECGKTGYWLKIDYAKDRWFEHLMHETTKWKVEEDNGFTDEERQDLLVWRLRMERDHVDNILEKVVNQNEDFLRLMQSIHELTELGNDKVQTLLKTIHERIEEAVIK